MNSSQPDFAERIKALRESQAENLSQVDGAVADIIADVRERGDDALLELTRRFDDTSATSAAELQVTPDHFEAAARAIDSLVLDALSEKTCCMCIQIIPCQVEFFDASVGLEHGRNGPDELLTSFSMPLSRHKAPSII